MKGKFLSVILTLAVCLGLLLVPALGVSAGDPPAGKATYQLPAAVYVSPNQAFTVNVTIYNPYNIDIYTAGADMVWNNTASLLNVTGISDEGWYTFLADGWNNTAGEAWYEGGGNTTPGYKCKNATNILHCKVAFVAGSSEGVVTVNFTPGVFLETVLYDVNTTDICDWTAGDMQNMTVVIGSPKLEVNRVGSGNVTINNTIIPASYPNTTTWSWNQVVPLNATANAGWTFVNWTGNVANPNSASTTVTMNTTGMNMDTLTKTVTANFAELPPQVSVSTHTVTFTGSEALRYGDNSANKTITISNIGGGLLNWTASSVSVPTWLVGNTWTWMEYYSMYPNGTPCPNPNYTPGWGVNDTPVVMTVTSASDPNNYTAFAVFVYPAQRSLEGLVGTMYNATVVVDKATLDNVMQLANVTVNFGGPVSLQAMATWNYAPAGYPALPHGWPYYVGKTWYYNVTTQILGVTAPSTSTCMAQVQGSQVVNTVLGQFTCWNIVHVDLTSGQPFKSVMWSDDARNFVQDVDAGTYDYPPPYIRSLIDMSPPAWLRIDPIAGQLGIGASQPLKVTVKSKGLAEGTYYGSFAVSGSGSEVVNVTLEVLPATTTNVFRNLPGNALELNQTYPGMTFDVWVNFTAPFDKMNAISLTDLAPKGWTVSVSAANCTANGAIPADYVKATGNKVEVTWWGDPNVGFAVGTQFCALYQVTVPVTAEPGINEFPNNDGSKAWAEYYEGEAGPYTSNVTDEYQIMITVPGYVVGETRDVNTNLLPDTLVTLERDSSAIRSDASTPNYSIICYNTGVYWLQAGKDGYYTLGSDWVGGHALHNVNLTQYIDLSTPALLAVGNVLDFEGDYGLIPQSCTMAYAMKSVNLYLFWPTGHSEWGLNAWKASQSIMSWQNPYHPAP